MTANLIIQWISIGIIFLIIVILAVRKIINTVRGDKSTPGCSCGNCSCGSACPGCADTHRNTGQHKF